MSISLSNTILSNIKVLTDNLPELENKIFLVGGCVRDAILGLSSDDMDFCIDCEPLILSNELKNAFKIETLVNEKFFSVKTIINNINYEFTSARKDYYREKSRYPKSCERVNINEDPYRRDFTINTLMVNINKPNEVLDFTGKGLSDLENKIIDTPCDPIKSFHEDPLRILRAIRFATMFNFKIHNRLYESIEINRHRLKILSKNNIKYEMDKMNDNGLELLDKLIKNSEFRIQN